MRLKLYALSLIARRGVLYALMSCQFDCILSLVGAVILLVSHFVLHCNPANGAPNKGCAIAELSNTGEIGRRFTSAGKSPTMHFYPMVLQAMYYS